MNRTPVNSSNLLSVGHCPETCVLEVEFKDKLGQPAGLYRYYDVPAHVAAPLTDPATPSVGSYFHKAIKGQYDCERMPIQGEGWLQRGLAGMPPQPGGGVKV